MFTTFVKTLFSIITLNLDNLIWDGDEDTGVFSPPQI